MSMNKNHLVKFKYLILPIALCLSGSIGAAPVDLSEHFNMRIAEQGHGGHNYHRGGGGWSGSGHNDVYWGVGNGGVYFGNNPYYEPYYYSSPRYIVVQPYSSSSSSSSNHQAVTKAKPTAEGIQIMKAQVQLTSLGYYNGAIDGISGSGTKAAVKAYQHDKGLAETGELNDATLSSLGVSK